MATYGLFRRAAPLTACLIGLLTLLLAGCGGFPVEGAADPSPSPVPSLTGEARLEVTESIPTATLPPATPTATLPPPIPPTQTLLTEEAASPSASPTREGGTAATAPAAEAPVKTPADRLSPTPSMTLESPTVTLTPTPTTAPTATPTAPPSPTIPPTPTATPTPAAPSMVSPLLFLSEGRLQRWDLASQTVMTLAEGVESFSASADGRRISLLRSLKVAAGGVELYELSLLEPPLPTLRPLLERTARLVHPRLSPDGRWLAYLLDTQGGTVYALSIEDPSQVVKLGLCLPEPERSCEPGAWSADSRSLLWSDDRGVWLGTPGESGRGGEPRQVTQNRMQVTDPRGSQSQLQVSFHDLRWSPAGRYALAEAHPYPSGVRGLAVIDTRTGLAVPVPGSSALQGSTARAVWLQDGQLLAAYSSDPAAGSPARAALWRMAPAHANLLLQTASFDLPSQSIGADPQDGGSGTAVLPDWLAQPAPAAVQFVLTVPGAYITPIAFRLDLRFGTSEQIAEFPYDTTAVFWSPDRHGALVLGKHTQVLFFRVSEEAPIDLHELFGPNPQDFTWLPPVSSRR